MMLTIERQHDDSPTGLLKVVGLRPATRLEAAISWLKGLFKKEKPNEVNLSTIDIPPGTPVSLGIQLTPETYLQLVNGNTNMSGLLADAASIDMALVAPSMSCAVNTDDSDIERTTV